MAVRSPSTKTPKVRIRDAASVRVDRASPAQAQSAAPVRAPSRPPGLVASVDLQIRSVLIGLVRGGRPPLLSSSAGGRATTQHARLYLFLSSRATKQAQNALRHNSHHRWPPKPTANQEAGCGAEHRDKIKAESSAFWTVM